MPHSDMDTLVDVRFSSKDVVSTLEPGSVVGDWQIDAFVAKGGFASVFRGRSLKTGQVGAIKVLRPELVESSTAILRFQREAQLMARISHPNIVAIHTIGEIVPGVPYIVMEWIDGQTLSDEYRRRGSFSPEEVLGVLEPLCSALAAAHAEGVVHRDLKPSNIMVIPEGDWFRIKLVDFGIAKLLEPESEAAYTSLTATGTFLGTPAYMAPEQFVGLRVDARTDVYALGVVSYLLLSGRLPFRAENPIEMAEMHRGARHAAISAIARVPAALDTVLDRALAKAPSARYESVKAFFDDVHRALQEPLPAPPQHVADAAAPHWLGIHVAVTVPTLDIELDDDLLAQIDAALAAAETTLISRGLQVVLDGAQAILAVRKAGASDTAELVRNALYLHSQIGPAFDRLQLTITVHTAPNADQITSLRWTANSPCDAVSVTSEAAAVVGDLELEPIVGTEAKLRVVAR